MSHPRTPADNRRNRPIQRITDTITGGLVLVMFCLALRMHSAGLGTPAALALLGAVLFALSTLYRLWNWSHDQTRFGAITIGIGDIGGMLCLATIMLYPTT